LPHLRALLRTGRMAHGGRIWQAPLMPGLCEVIGNLDWWRKRKPAAHGLPVEPQATGNRAL